MNRNVVFIDLEISEQDKRAFDFGAVNEINTLFHSKSKADFTAFISSSDFACGHNIVEHDSKYCQEIGAKFDANHIIDTLYMSPLLFPSKPYHKLLKDDKILSEQFNNPASDALKAKELFYDEVNTYQKLSQSKKHIYSALLKNDVHFRGFFEYVGTQFYFSSVESEIKKAFAGLVCSNADIAMLVNNVPVELAYSLAIISTQDKYSITPPWVFYTYPKVENVIKLLRGTPCKDGCTYCNRNLNVRVKLKDFFGFESFRTYNGEPLQEMAADAAVHNKSLLAIFPTGGGKSITYQLPALTAGEQSHGLTIIISPLQSLMKDQVDNLEKMGIVDAVTINGLLSPIERAEAIERVRSGMASILYISPESLRSNTIEKLLISRNVVRFVIDEAHCFSAWGQDFRVDYMYIGDFIRNYMKTKNLNYTIPISCFTATAKQKVISDIRDYFRQKLEVELEIYATSATRTNLRYAVLYRETEEEKYSALRNLIEHKNCPTIVYVSRTRRTWKLADKLTKDGYPARPFNGKMESREKIENQEAFINNEFKVIVATSAFGMGVDKKDVGLVVHYDISDSLENYVQEAGRAGRDQSINAECYVLYNDSDLDKHFILLNQTKLSFSEIQQVWKAIKDLTKTRPTLCRSALEIARAAGWDENIIDVETRVKTAIAALENAGYVERGKNVPRIYATSIQAKDMDSARMIIDGSDRFNEAQKMNSIRIVKSLISKRSISKAIDDEAESRVDYLADILGIEKAQVIEAITLMREEGLLADSMDMSAFIRKADNQNKSLQALRQFCQLEKYLLTKLSSEDQHFNYKELNDNALKSGIKGSKVNNIKTIFYFWTIKNYIKKNVNAGTDQTCIFCNFELEKMEKIVEKRNRIAEFIVTYLYEKVEGRKDFGKEEVPVQFSILELKDSYNNRITMFEDQRDCTTKDVEDALLYLSKIESMNLEGGFLVLYNAMNIKRLILDNRIKYKHEDYKTLDEFYQNRIQQIHIVGEYANMMVRNYNDSLQFVNDYFQMEYKAFIAKYFKGNREGEINLNITPQKYKKLFGELSEIQTEIIRDDLSQYITVIAGPGSGKTKVLVHKLASLLLLEDVKSEQLLMLTFSRAAATEFKARLMGLIGNAAHFVEIKTFHSYCFDLLGKIGNLDESQDIVQRAAEMIQNGEVEIGKITKTVLVIDEAQDMDIHEFTLVNALMSRNEDMRVIAVGDDDQNIYEFRGSDSSYMKSLITSHGAKCYEMVDNYRSSEEIVGFANAFANTISNRIKRQPIVSVSDICGKVLLTKHVSTNLETALVDEVIRTYHGEKACVLTATNEEALRVMCLLTENGLNARLIQSNDGFNLYNLAEIRLFIKEIEKEQYSPIISEKAWNDGIERLKRVYEESTALPIAIKIINTFSSVNSKKYKSDFIEFVNESKLEDFYDSDNSTIMVSTIHKSKGHEFDTVYILLSNNVNFYNENNKRAVYVGLTRAKSALFVHYTSDFLDRFRLSGVEYVSDKALYPEPEKIMLQLSHRDVFLSFFKDKKKDILLLQSGSPLNLKGNTLYGKIND